jgi:hypothetical protein
VARRPATSLFIVLSYNASVDGDQADLLIDSDIPAEEEIGVVKTAREGVRKSEWIG